LPAPSSRKTSPKMGAVRSVDGSAAAVSDTMRIAGRSSGGVVIVSQISRSSSGEGSDGQRFGNRSTTARLQGF
jgi:hypothetical protein